MSIEIKSAVEQVSLLDENWKKEELASSGGHILCKAMDEGIFSIEMHLPKGGVAGDIFFAMQSYKQIHNCFPVSCCFDRFTIFDYIPMDKQTPTP